MPPQPDSDLPDAFTVHQVPGRTRLRVPARRGDRTYFAHIAQALALAPEVLLVRVNPSTGSILLLHTSPLQKLAGYAAEGGLFRLAAAPAAPFRRATRIEPRPRIAPLSLLSAGLAGLGVIQLARARVAGTAIEHLWGAYQASRTLGRPGVVATLAAIGVVQLARGRVLSPAVSLLSYALTARSFARRNAGHH
jgi:hypothetical protein